MLNILNLIRIHHWTKNSLIFIPLLLSGSGISINFFLLHLYAFFAFSFAASSVYIFNDYIDRENDANHPIKKNRPIASGKFSSKLALKISFLLLASSFLISFFIGFKILVPIIIYVLLNFAYTIFFKRIYLFDCIVLSFFYTMRILVGTIISQETPSFWLILFSIFIFLSLALSKRFQEIKLFSKNRDMKILGRGYKTNDNHLLMILGIITGVFSIIVLSLYLNSEKALTLYSNSISIWLLVLFVSLWLGWVWLKTIRGEISSDPLVFAFKDKISLFILVCGITTFFISKEIKFIL